MRVFEVAKDLSVPAEGLVQLLREMDIPVRSHMSDISDEHVARVRTWLERERRLGHRDVGEAVEAAIGDAASAPRRRRRKREDLPEGEAEPADAPQAEADSTASPTADAAEALAADAAEAAAERGAELVTTGGREPTGAAGRDERVHHGETLGGVMETRIRSTPAAAMPACCRRPHPC